MPVDTQQAQARLTPEQIIKKHFDAWERESEMTWTVYSTLVREYHEARYPEHARSVEWSTVESAHLRMQRDAEKVMRWFDKGVNARVPLEMYDALVSVFPPQRREALEVELAAQRNMLVIPLPQASCAEDVANLGDIAREVGDVLREVGRLIEDGRIDANDRDLAPEAIRQINEAIAKLAEMRTRIEVQALGLEVDDNIGSLEGRGGLRVAK